MSQIEVTKLTAYAGLGVPAGHVGVTKLVAYAVLVPGEGDDDTTRQGRVFVQIVRR